MADFTLRQADPIRSGVKLAAREHRQKPKTAYDFSRARPFMLRDRLPAMVAFALLLQTAAAVPSTCSIAMKNLDDRTITIYAKSPVLFPYIVPTMLMVSPKQWRKTGCSWTAFARTPSGAGPFRAAALTDLPFARNRLFRAV